MTEEKKEKKVKTMTCIRPSGSTIELADTPNLRKYCAQHKWQIK